MIVKDEEPRLARCLASVAPFSPQIVVVDTGSTDATADIARGLGAEVFPFAWGRDFSAARNASLERARGVWTLVLDADEWLEPAAQKAIALLLRLPPARAFALVQKSRDSDQGFIRNGIVRLFPNRPDIRYRHRIHEDVMISLSRAKIPVEHTEIEIEHSGYEDPALLGAKLARNRGILEEMLREPLEDSARYHVRFNLGMSLLQQGETARALSEFAWCVAHSPADSRTHGICKLKAAECLFALDRPAEARALLPPKPDPTQHPAALRLAARIAHGDDSASARPWLEALLQVPDVAHAFPVNLAALKFDAVVELGRIALGQGDLSRARALVNLAKALREGGPDAASQRVAQWYRDATAPGERPGV